MSELVHLTIEGDIATITLARPQKLNALDAEMIAALQAHADAIEREGAVRCALIVGEGKAFCAGGDVAAWGALPAIEMWRRWTRAGHRAFDALARLRVPLVAVLTGHAFGGVKRDRTTASIDDQASVAAPPAANRVAALTVDDTNPLGTLADAIPRFSANNTSDPTVGATPRCVSRFASIALPRDKRPETVPIGQPSRSAASPCDFPSSSHSTMGLRYLSGNLLSS